MQSKNSTTIQYITNIASKTTSDLSQQLFYTAIYSTIVQHGKVINEYNFLY